MGIQFAKSETAQKLLDTPEFGQQWADLYEKCPWATIFQSFQYLRIWNRNYRKTCETLIIYETGENEELIGLFPLAKCRKSDKIFVAGDYHAEYQTWLATPENGNEFPKKAFDLLSREFPDKRLQMMFIAPHTPLEWLSEKWGEQSCLQTIPRPIVNLNKENNPARSLRKRGNKTRIRQLKKQGELTFNEVKSVAEFSEAFDEIENFSHLRLSAIHNVHLDKDHHRKPFHLDLMRETDVVYPTLMKVGEKTASAQVCFRNNDEMLLCLTSMSPFFARQSPSKIHLLMLGSKLSETDYKSFDLSPGEGYKERFANEIKETHSLKVFFNKSDHRCFQIKRRFVGSGRKFLEKINLKKSKIFQLADKIVYKLKRLRLRTVPRTIYKNIVSKIYEHKECRMYSYDVHKIKSLENPNLMNLNSVEDLLKYEPTESWQDTKSQFHRKVLDRFGQKIHSYSYAENGTLLHYGWRIEDQKVSNVTEVGQTFDLPSGSAVLFDYYTHKKSRGRGFYQKAILQGLHDAAQNPQTKQVFIGVLADNGPSRHIIEKLGFKYEGSLYKETRFGVVKKWQDWVMDSSIKERVC